MADGPDPDYREPGGHRPADGFSTARAGGPVAHGSPEDVARGKAAIFPDEGGAVIIEMDVPEHIVWQADDFVDEVRFSPGVGLEDLVLAWHSLQKRLIELW